MHLLIVRHGDAVSDNVDPSRPLSKKGIENVNNLSKKLAKYNIEIDVVFHSTKKRAIETAEIIVNSLSPSAEIIEKDCLSPNDSTDEIVYQISSLNQNTMIVGHLPFLSKLVSRLVINDEYKGIVSFDTSSAVLLEKGLNDKWYLGNMYHGKSW